MRVGRNVKKKSVKLTKAALFGVGYFGSNHLKYLSTWGALKYGVDTNAEKREHVEKAGGKFLSADLTKAVEIVRDKKGDPIGHRINKDLPEVKELAKKTDVWDIVTPSDTHFPLMLLGLELGKKIFVEKPATDRTSEVEYLLKRFPKAAIGVDYIERGHPVVRAIKKRMAKEKFAPSSFFNYRGKDERSIRRMGGGEGERIILTDLVHDMSEIGLFRRHLMKARLKKKSLPKIKDAWIQTWEEIGYPYPTDVKARFKLASKRGPVAEVWGSFAGPEVRQFLITDKSGKIAYYGNTLSRPHIDPIAARVVGEKNIMHLRQNIENRKISTTDVQNKILKDANAEILKHEIMVENPESLATMLRNALRAKSNKDLISPLKHTLAYQRIAEKVYRAARKPKAMAPPART